MHEKVLLFGVASGEVLLFGVASGEVLELFPCSWEIFAAVFGFVEFVLFGFVEFASFLFGQESSCVVWLCVLLSTLPQYWQVREALEGVLEPSWTFTCSLKLKLLPQVLLQISQTYLVVEEWDGDC